MYRHNYIDPKKFAPKTRLQILCNKSTKALCELLRICRWIKHYEVIIIFATIELSLYSITCTHLREKKRERKYATSCSIEHEIDHFSHQPEVKQQVNFYWLITPRKKKHTLDRSHIVVVVVEKCTFFRQTIEHPKLDVLAWWWKQCWCWFWSLFSLLFCLFGFELILFQPKNRQYLCKISSEKKCQNLILIDITFYYYFKRFSYFLWDFTTVRRLNLRATFCCCCCCVIWLILIFEFEIQQKNIDSNRIEKSKTKKVANTFNLYVYNLPGLIAFLSANFHTYKMY